MADQKYIRMLLRRDMQEVLEIERLSFGFPWSDEDFLRVLNMGAVNACVYEAPHRGRETFPPLYGYMIYELHEKRLHLLNFAVHPEFRSLGVGRAMVDRLLGKLNQQRRNRITLEVRERNLDAQLFFSLMGFRAVTVLRSWYADSDEDAYLFQFRLKDESEVQDGGVCLSRRAADAG
jgi:[ribosomal protein S18]-alanine N-acetyltransferase